MNRSEMVLTIGHSTRSGDALIAALDAHGVRRLVDIRTIPRSRHNPQFNREALAEALPAAGIAYEHRPGLGGLRRPRPDSPNGGWRIRAFAALPTTCKRPRSRASSRRRWKRRGRSASP
jgi:hypothetical protein